MAWIIVAALQIEVFSARSCLHQLSPAMYMPHVSHFRFVTKKNCPIDGSNRPDFLTVRIPFNVYSLQSLDPESSQPLFKS